MKPERKDYKVNKDVAIACITKYDNFGNKFFDIFVYDYNLPWEEIFEQYRNIIYKDEANCIFKKMSAKYKNFVI